MFVIWYTVHFELRWKFSLWFCCIFYILKSKTCPRAMFVVIINDLATCRFRCLRSWMWYPGRWRDWWIKCMRPVVRRNNLPTCSMLKITSLIWLRCEDAICSGRHPSPVWLRCEDAICSGRQKSPVWLRCEEAICSSRQTSPEWLRCNEAICSGRQTSPEWLRCNEAICSCRQTWPIWLRCKEAICNGKQTSPIWLRCEDTMCSGSRTSMSKDDSLLKIWNLVYVHGAKKALGPKLNLNLLDF